MLEANAEDVEGDGNKEGHCSPPLQATRGSRNAFINCKLPNFKLVSGHSPSLKRVLVHLELELTHVETFRHF